MSTTPNMGLVLPIETVTPGPEWATDLNTALSVVDEHDHTPGKGVLVPIAGIDFNADVDVNAQIINNADSLYLNQKASVLPGTETGALSNVNGDAYWNDGSGNAIQITQGGTLYPPVVVGIPTGIMFPYGGTVAPSGYLLCNGAAVSRTTYSDLFTTLGTAFGIGDGSTTFNLPDTQGRAPIGVGTYTDPVQGAVTRTLGQSLGASQHLLTSSEMPSHNHTLTDPGHAHTVANQFNADTGGNGVFAAGAGQNTGTATTGITLANTGGGTVHNNMQPSLAVNYIIKT
jgi:microcystin-dependent protein